MAQDNLLRDAIAEAKQVKAAAIASAKIALEEAFQPHLQSMLSRHLSDSVNPSSSGIGTGNNKTPSSDSNDSSHIPNPAQEVEAMGQGTSGADPKIGGSRKAANNETDAHPVTLREANPFGGEEEEEENEFDVEPDNDEDDMAGVNQSGGEFGGMGGEDPMAAGGGEEVGMDMGGEESPMGGDMGMGGDTVDIGDALKNLIKAVVQELEGDVEQENAMMGGNAPMTEETIEGTPNEKLAMGKGTSGEDDKIGGDAKKAPNGSDGHPEKLHEEEEEEETVEEEVDLTEILREMDVQENVQGQGVDPNYYTKVEKIMSENANLKRSLKEHRDVVRFLKDRINEINMLNAKLLFTNKLFKQFDLNAGQKMRVVETFDRATTLREVKLIFATLGEAYAAKNSASTKKVRSITEGIASRATGSTKPKNPQMLTEGDEVVRRFKQLANIL